MAYGTIKVDTITFTNGGVDKSVTISGLVQNPTFTGNVTVTGTVSGTTAIFTTGTFTTLTGGVATITSGVFALGTAALPSISFAGSDTDTGIYSPGANQVAITTSGSGRLFVNASGNIGIGTANPVSQIHIQKATAGLAGLHISNSTHGSTAADGFFAGIDDNLAYLYNYENLPIVFGTNSTERLRIHGDGKIGIGTTETINRQLVLHDNTLACLALQSATTGSADNDGFQLQLISSDVYIWNYENGFTAFGTNSLERMQIDSSGRLLVGTSSARTAAGITSRFQVEGSGVYDNYCVNLIANTNVGAAESPALVFSRSRGTSNGSATAVQNGDRLGSIAWTGANGSDLSNLGGLIECYIDGAVSGGGANDMPGRLVFSTTADGASSPTERLRITSAGFVGIGTSSPAQLLHLKGSGDTKLLLNSASNTSDRGIYFATDTDSEVLGYIKQEYSTGQLQISSGTGSYASDIAFMTAGSERARIDTSGRLLVGTTTTSANATLLLQGYNGTQTNAGGHLRLAIPTATPADGANLGVVLFSDSTHTNCATISADRDGGTWSGTSKPSRLTFSTTANGASSPTERMRIASDGIVTIKTSANDIAIGGALGTTIAAATRAGVHFGAPASLIPTDGDGALTDNACSLGIGAYRWSTVYAGTGTINTSDSTLKQDIAGLGQAELNVAATIKTRIKKFRFVDAVASKGDDARIHVGVIAQEVEQAFVDEGLDPRRYAMFCEDTLDDGSKRLGIRYDELLTFVIAAL